MLRMRRSTMLVFVVLGVALAALALSTTAGRLGGGKSETEPSVAAGPQSARLDWREPYGSGANRIVFEVERMEVGPVGWSARVAITNDTPVPYALGDPGATLDREFGVKLFATDDPDELERQIANGTLPTTRAARSFDPALPKILEPGATWRGAMSAPGALAAGSFLRVVFGPLLSVSTPPEGMSDNIVWITDNAYELQR
jgi:hypothetical protein